MKTWQSVLCFSCLIAQNAYAQPALDPAFVNYLVDFGDQPELFDAANQDIEQTSTSQKANTQSNSNNNPQTAKESQP